ncbi:glycosyltransferase family 4 protein [Gracilibacillus boraciitolerans]
MTFCYNHGDIVLTPTDYSKHILDHYRIKRPVYHLSNGIDTEFFKPTGGEGRQRFRKRYHIGEEEKVIISVGHYMERKGILDFIKLAEQMPEYRFYWFGYTNLHIVPAKIKRAIQNKGGANLYFPGYVSRQELRDAYEGSDVFLFLTHEETEGIVLLEALAAKIPIVVRDIPIYKKWLKHNHTVYKGKTIDEFSQLCKGLLEKQLPNLTANGFDLASERDIRVVATKLMKFYHA